MAAGVTDRLWEVADLVALWELMSNGGRKERRERWNRDLSGA